MEEYFDILDKKGEKTGESRSDTEAHRNGLTHRVVHVWLLNFKRQLLWQKRSKEKRVYPSQWDMSVARHVSAGQTSLEAAQKETEEELGLVVPDSNFQYLFTVEEHIVLNSGRFVNNEFQDVFLVRSDVSTSELKLAPDEVEEVRWIDIKDFEEWIKGEKEAVIPHEEEYRKLLEYLNNM
jgi:isopentenyldiphosphate isomerase